MLIVAAPRVLSAQERGAIALGEAVLGLGVNTRVLMIGAHPDDEDTFLISWLSRGRQVETGYLSLTRGDGGQNLIGNELGEALGVIRTEELLAARRIDGARQYFTRAYDFGFSKTVEDTYKHWPKDSILGDVIRVVRAFRPHVIVAVFSGTPRDGHGHHQVSGILAREAYELSADTVQFPLANELPWRVSKFYRSARLTAQAGTLAYDAGEYSPLVGRSYAEIAGESRSQHRSQGFGALQRKGPLLAYLRREATRVNESTPAAEERSIFDGIDTSWARFRPALTDAEAQASLDSLAWAFRRVREEFNPFAPDTSPLSEVYGRLYAVFVHLCGDPELGSRCRGALPPRELDLQTSIWNAMARVHRAQLLASGVAVEALAERELQPVGREFRVFANVYNRGRDTLMNFGAAIAQDLSGAKGVGELRELPPGGVLRDTLVARMDSTTQPWWLARGRVGAMFVAPASRFPEDGRRSFPYVMYSQCCEDVGGPTFAQPITYRFADQIKGEIQRVVNGVPAITISLDQRVAFVPASVPINRELNVRLRSADPNARDVRVSLRLPAGVTADSAMRSMRLDGYNATKTLTFRLAGRLAVGEHVIAAVAESNGETFAGGYQQIEYDHIRPQRVYHPATVRLSAVDIRVPTSLRVAYIAGVSDNVAPALAQLGIRVTVIPAQEIAMTDLQSYTTVVVGPRAYEAHPELVAANARLLDFARSGGTVLVQYGQYEMMQPGIMPYAMTIPRPHDRVTQEDAPVTLIEPGARELSWPNRIVGVDFAGWVQERALYMPRSFDQRYRPLLAMNDPGEPPNQGAILVAPIGQGRYIYTTLAFFRQLPAGVPGAARLFVNLLSAGVAPSATP